MPVEKEYIYLGERLISEFLSAIKDELVAYMQTDNRNATGRSAQSIRLANITNSSGQLVGAGHIEFVFTGRGPGSMPPISQLIDWCNARGLPRRMAWAVAKTIAASGTKLWREGRNVLKEIVTLEKVEKLKQDILNIYTAQVKSDIRSILQAA